MTGSSDEASNAFDDLSLQHVRTFLELLAGTELRDKEYVKRRYLERAPHFDATLRFLTQLNVVEDDGRTLSSTSQCGLGRGLRGDELQSVLIKRLVETDSPLREELFRYLRQFEIVDNRAVCRPTPEQRSSESALRNFLMELAIVSYDRRSEQYVLDVDHSSLYAAAAASAASICPSTIRTSRQAKEEIGLAAECAIVGYEQQRVGERFENRVNHVAARNAAAGYDVESVTVVAEALVVPRFIEVKAVSLKTLRFYWTANEVQVAQSLGSWYYLYLLPVDGRRHFKMDLLRIICDPHSAVLGCPDQWNVEHNVVRCEMRTNTEEQV